MNERELEQETAQFDAAVDWFAMAMKAKLRRKAQQGYRGGLEQDSRPEVMRRLHEHIAKGGLYCEEQEVDIANLLMMLWHQRKEKLLLEMYGEIENADR